MNQLVDLEYQLNFVENELANDPSNDELIKLKQDLLEMIDLASLKNTKPDTKIESETKEEIKEELDYSIGDYVLVKSKVEGELLEARIETITADFKKCTVLISKNSKIEMVPLKNVKKKIFELTNEEEKVDVPQVEKKKRSAEIYKAEKSQKKQTLEEHRAKKEKEHAEKQNTWLSFQKSGNIKKRLPGSGLIKRLT